MVKKNIFYWIFCLVTILVLTTCRQRENKNNLQQESNFSADTVRVRQLHKLFKAYIDSNAFDKLKPIADEEYAIAKRINFEDGLADALTDLRSHYSIVGDHKNAAKCLLQALKMNEKNNREAKMAHNYIDLGMVHYHQNNYEPAIEYYKKALRLNEKLGNRSNIATDKYLIALALIDEKKDSMAEPFLNESLQIQMEEGQTRRVAECEIVIGDIFLRRKQYANAMRFYNSAEQHFEQINEAMGVPVINISLARYFLENNQLKKAESCAISSVNYFTKILYVAQMIPSYDILHQVYAAEGQYEKAYKVQLQLQLLKDSVFGSANTSNVAIMEASRELEKTQEENKQKTRQVQTEETLRNFFMAGFCIVAILAFLTFIQYRSKNRTAKKLEETLQHLKATQEQLVYTEKMSSLGTLSAGIAHEIQNPLNFVNNFSDLGMDLIDEIDQANSEPEKKEILKDLKNNLRKINEHGKRADGIVKSMLEHTHIGSREKRPTDLNFLANEFFTLAYQSFRAKEPGFTCKIEKHLDPNLPQANLNPQDVSRVLINLFNNALFALNRKRLTEQNEFMPEITLSSHATNNKIYFSVKDNGTGIPNEILGKIFQPFFTTKSSGEGTGLGLSLSNEIITQGHGGTLEVKTRVGEGSEFIITLPV